MRGKVDHNLKAECIRLRIKERKSFGEINKITGAAKGTLSSWLKDFPLTDKEKQIRRKNRPSQKKDRGKESKFHKVIAKQKLSRLQKSKIAEAAILFRLTLHGFNAFGSPFDGDKTDWLVEIPGVTKTYRIQVKWAGWYKRGAPIIPLRCASGHYRRRLYKEGEFDFIIGYDFFTDIAYVFSWDEVKHLKGVVSVRENAAERWDKLRL